MIDRRGPKARLDPHRAYAALWEEEPDASGTLIPTAVVFLTNRECPFHCVMCDLWINTLDETVPRGAIARQIRTALEGSAAGRRQIKLYNAGSFFDPLAIPPGDDEEIAEAVRECERVIVESHPAFLAARHGERCLRFRDRLRGRLEVAIGLETAHPDVLARLNKRMTLDSFARAARFLGEHDIDLRVFILLNPPFLPPDESVEWACRSLDLAAACGACACSIIPTRSGNGAIEALGADYTPPGLAALETVMEYGVSLDAGRPLTGRKQGMRVFADLWEIDRFFECACSPARARRLGTMNRTQLHGERVTCACTARM